MVRCCFAVLATACQFSARAYSFWKLADKEIAPSAYFRGICRTFLVSDNGRAFAQVGAELYAASQLILFAFVHIDERNEKEGKGKEILLCLVAQ